MKRTIKRLAPLALLSLLCVGPTLACCADKLPASGWPPRQVPSRPRTLKVGVARTQITPPPGVSLFGHGPNSRVAAGVWTRLYCRAFVFEAESGEVTDRFALVSCDLPAISTLLQRTAVQRAGELGLNISASRLLLAATHTHAGPAHYFGAANYNGMMSTRLPGFDDEVLKFLAGRIAQALKTAHERLRPSRLAWAHRQFWNFTRNRSLLPFRLNRRPYRPPIPGSTDGWFEVWHRLPGDRRAIDPNLDTLWIYDAERSTISGAISFLAMHPTMLGPLTQLFSGDIFGVASRDIDEQMRLFNEELTPWGQVLPPPYHAIVNTNSGDMAAVWSSGSTDEVVKRGQQLGLLIWGQRQPVIEDASPTVHVGIRYTEAYLPGADAGKVKVKGKYQERRLCQEAELGWAAPKGATDHATFFQYWDRFNNAQLTTRCCRPCQEPKKSMLGWFQGVVTTKHSFPRWAPMATLQLGKALIAFVPAELTITAGARVREALATRARERGLAVEKVIVAGHTNGYIQYVTTCEEYYAQYYEGASTLYGRHTLAFITRQLTELVEALAGSPGVVPSEQADEHPYSVGTPRKRMPNRAAAPALATLGAARKPIRFCRLPGAIAPTICFIWADGAPGRVWWASATPDPWIPKQHWIEVHAGQGDTSTACGSLPGIDNDEGYRFKTRAHEESEESDAWIWSSTYRFTRHRWDRLTRDGEEVCIRARDSVDGDVTSAVYTACKIPVCTASEALFCEGQIAYADRHKPPAP